MTTTTAPTATGEPVLQKFATPLLSLVVVMITAITAALTEPITQAVIWQLVIIFAGSVVTFFVPLLDNAWAGGLKTSAAILAAIATAVVPYVVNGGHLTGPEILTVVLAAFKALATEIGVQIRTEPQQAVIGADGVPSITNVAPAGPSDGSSVPEDKAPAIPSFDSIISPKPEITPAVATPPVSAVRPVLPPEPEPIPVAADVPTLHLPEDVPTASEPVSATASVPVPVPESTPVPEPVDVGIPVPDEAPVAESPTVDATGAPAPTLTATADSLDPDDVPSDPAPGLVIAD